MSAITKIEWSDRTWNCVRGCSVISPGCVNCYAMKQAHRFSGAGKPYEGLTKQTKAGPQWTGVIRTVDSALLEPLSWREPQRVFVNSMSDLFHEGVPDSFIDQVFAVMAWCDRHTFQILTKRADRMRGYMEKLTSLGTQRIGHRLAQAGCPIRIPTDTPTSGLVWPLPNVWLGVSVEDQRHAEARIPQLLNTPSAIRFISAEPLLGAIDLRNLDTAPELHLDALTGVELMSEVPATGPKLDWVIVGGESGNRARPFDVEWARSIVKQCAAADVACFVKQLGANPWDTGRNSGFKPGVMLDEYNVRYELKDKKGGDINEFPTSLRVRQFPKAAA